MQPEPPEPALPGFRLATRIELDTLEGLCSLEWIKPPTQPLSLPGVDQEFQVWEGRVDFVLPVSADDHIAGMVDDTATQPVEIGVQGSCSRESARREGLEPP